MKHLTPEDLSFVVADGAQHIMQRVNTIFAQADRALTNAEYSVVYAHLREAVGIVLKGIELPDV